MSENAFFWRTFYVLSGLTIMGPLAFDTFLPAMGDAAAGLNTDMGTILITISMVQLGNATGQIIYGPLSDRYGRRPVILFGLVMYIVTAGASSFLTSVEPLFVLRLLQGSAIACSMIIFRAVVRDLFDLKDGARMYAHLYLVLSIMPLLGPIIGGYLTEQFGWRSVFLFMVGCGMLVFLVTLVFLKESLKDKDVRAMTPKVLAVSFAQIIRHRTFVAFLICGMGAYGGLFAVLAGLAPVMVGFMGETPTVFGFQFAAVMAGHLAAAAVTGKLVARWGIKKTMLMGTLISAIGGGLVLALALAEIATRISILLPTTIYMVGFAFTISPMTAGAMSSFPNMAGRSASLLGFLQQSAGASVTFSLGLFEDGTQLPMVIALAGCSLFAFLAYLVLVRPVPLAEDEPPA